MGSKHRGAVLDKTIASQIEAGRRLNQLPPSVVRRRLRRRAGVTQAAVAEAVGVNRATVSRWEAGVCAPRGENLLHYLEVLDLLRLEARS